MPKELEQRLQREAAKRWPDDKEHQDRYVYGTLAKLKTNRIYGRRQRRK